MIFIPEEFLYTWTFKKHGQPQFVPIENMQNKLGLRIHGENEVGDPFWASIGKLTDKNYIERRDPGYRITPEGLKYLQPLASASIRAWSTAWWLSMAPR